MKTARLVALTTLAIALPAAQAAEFSLRYLGEHRIETGAKFDNVEFGGISGIDFDAGNANPNRYVALSDDRGGERGTPRFYDLTLDFDLAGFHGVTINSQTYMKRPDGTTFPSTQRTVDPEGLRIAPNGNLYWSSEGNFNTNPANLYQPFVREMQRDGTYVRQFGTPAMYDYVDSATTGGRNNKLFEALTVSPDGARLYTANEDAIVQDGPITSLTNGSVVRVTALDVATGGALAQYAYELPPIPKDAVPGAPFGPDNGLPELLAVSDTQFIAVERAFAFGVGNTIKLVLTDLTGATDVSGFASLSGAAYTPMSKETLLDLDTLGITLDNSEGLTWGPTLANGHRSLVLVSDNNFSATQFTQFLAFEVVPVPEPETYALLLGGLGILAVAARRRRV